jgi:hypothetical protein
MREPGRWGIGLGILCAMVGSIHFRVSLWEYAAAASAQGGDAET